MKFGTEKSVEIFKQLATRPGYEVACEYGFDKVYKNRKAVSNAIYRLFTQIKNEPDKYGVSQEVVDMVVSSMQEKKLFKNTSKTLIKKEGEFEIKPAMMSIRDKAFRLIDKKLDMVGKSKSKLDKMSFKELGTIGGIAFDKARLLDGEATEHISLHSKIDKDISPEDAMNLILKMREVSIVEKEKTTN